MITYARKVKDEIASLSLSKEEAVPFLKGIMQIGGSVNFSSSGLSLDLESKNESVINKTFELVKDCFSLEGEILSYKEKRLNKEDVFVYSLKNNASLLVKDLDMLKAKEDSDYSLKRELKENGERVAYIRGAFLASGSLNDPSSNNYHLEIQTYSSLVAYSLRDLLNTFQLGAKISNNRRGYIVYLKSADKIADFLRVLGCTETLFYFEDYRIERDLNNSINRVMNCEIANEKKSEEAFKIMEEAISKVEKAYGKSLKKTLVEAIKLRKELPDESLQGLADKSSDVVGKAISKSALNHRFREIRELASKIDNIR